MKELGLGDYQRGLNVPFDRHAPASNLEVKMVNSYCTAATENYKCTVSGGTRYRPAQQGICVCDGLGCRCQSG